MQFTRSFICGAAALVLSIGLAQATPITGTANISGNVTVSASSILFNSAFVSTPGGIESGAFSGLTGGSIQSLGGGPATGSVNVPAFALFNQGTATPVTFDLTYIFPGTGSLSNCNSPGLFQACSLPGSPFNLYQFTANTVFVELVLNGTAYTGTSGTGTTATTGAFSTQFAINGGLQSVFQTLSSGGSITANYSAQFVALPTPEPASLLLLGAGLIGAGLIARRRIKS